MFAILRDWSTPQNRIKAALSRGKPSRMARGSWVADLAALKKAITLCAACQPKWSAQTNGYERRDPVPGYREARGECDGCAGKNEMCAVYFPKEKH